jgi:hypothetical protein
MLASAACLYLMFMVSFQTGIIDATILVWIAKQDRHFLLKWDKHGPEGRKMCPSKIS